MSAEPTVFLSASNHMKDYISSLCARGDPSALAFVNSPLSAIELKSREHWNSLPLLIDGAKWVYFDADAVPSSVFNPKSGTFPPKPVVSEAKQLRPTWARQVRGRFDFASASAELQQPQPKPQLPRRGAWRVGGRKSIYGNLVKSFQTRNEAVAYAQSKPLASASVFPFSSGFSSASASASVFPSASASGSGSASETEFKSASGFASASGSASASASAFPMLFKVKKLTKKELQVQAKQKKLNAAATKPAPPRSFASLRSLKALGRFFARAKQRVSNSTVDKQDGFEAVFDTSASGAKQFSEETEYFSMAEDGVEHDVDHDLDSLKCSELSTPEMSPKLCEEFAGTKRSRSCSIDMIETPLSAYFDDLFFASSSSFAADLSARDNALYPILQQRQDEAAKLNQSASCAPYVLPLHEEFTSGSLHANKTPKASDADTGLFPAQIFSTWKDAL